MPTYEISAPSGEKFEITAPEGASEEEVMAYVQSQFSLKPESEPDGGFWEDVETFGKSIPRGLTLGTSDTIGKGIQAGIFALAGDDDPWGRAEQLRQARVQDLNELQKRNPVAGLAGEVVGTIPLAQAGSLVAPGWTAYAAQKPLRAAGTVGAGVGGIYGAGVSEGTTLEDIMYDAGWGATGGAIGGPLGYKATQAAGYLGAKVINPLTERATKLFGKKSGGKLATRQMIPDATDTQVDDLALMAQSDDQIMAMTKGQKTQDPKFQKLESEAMAGVYGDRAETTARMAATAQSRQREAFLRNLGDIDDVRDVNELVEGTYKTIKGQAKKAKEGVNDAYDLAREGGGTKIGVDDIYDSWFMRVADVKRSGGYDLNSMPLARERVKDMARLMRRSAGGRFDDASLESMEKVRTKITTSMNSTTDRSEKKFLGEMLRSYDDFMYKTANEAVDQGDEAAIMAFRNAVSKRAEYGRLYESDKFVKDIVSGNKGLDDVAKDLMGAGSIAGKKRLNETYQALIKAAGEEAPQVKADLQGAFAKKILEQSTQGLEVGGERAFLSAAKMRTALIGLFRKNKEFATSLYGEDAVKVVNQVINELEYIASTQAATQNPSGSGQLVLRALRKTPIVNVLGESLEASSRAFKEGAAEKSFGEIVRTMKIKPKSKLFTVGAVSGAREGAEFIVEEE